MDAERLRDHDRLAVKSSRQELIKACNRDREAVEVGSVHALEHDVSRASFGIDNQGKHDLTLPVVRAFFHALRERIHRNHFGWLDSGAGSIDLNAITWRGHLLG